MKIALLSSASSIHTIRWANGLAEAGLEVHVISQHSQLEPMNDKVKIYILPFRGLIGYFTMVPTVKRILKKIQPDIVNAHYASGYATTAHLVGYHPWILSVWGSDVYDFPNKSPIHRMLIRKNLLSSDKVASTSVCMARQTNSFTPELENIAITPFGVDTKYYDSLTDSLFKRDNTNEIVIGTVKTLAPKYGVDTLIRAFACILKDFSNNHPDIVSKLRLRLVGDGPQRATLENLTQRLNIADRVDFIGRVNSNNVPLELNELDIYVALSRLDSESFGVAIIEAGAAGRPVVVSNVGGLPEVVIKDKTGFIVPKDDPQAAAKAISTLILDQQLRVDMGEAGKRHVTQTYDWNICIATMVSLYKETINEYNNKKRKL